MHVNTKRKKKILSKTKEIITTQHSLIPRLVIININIIIIVVYMRGDDILKVDNSNTTRQYKNLTILYTRGDFKLNEEDNSQEYQYISYYSYVCVRSMNMNVKNNSNVLVVAVKQLQFKNLTTTNDNQWWGKRRWIRIGSIHCL